LARKAPAGTALLRTWHVDPGLWHTEDSSDVGTAVKGTCLPTTAVMVVMVDLGLLAVAGGFWGRHDVRTA
jgi:hypothetical protein